MDTIFKNLSQLFTPEESHPNDELQSKRTSDQSHSHTQEFSERSRGISPTTSRDKSRNYPARKSSPNPIRKFFGKIQSWLESGDEDDDDLLAYTDEDSKELRGRDIRDRGWNERVEVEMDERFRLDGYEESRSQWEEDEERGLRRTKSYSEPPRGRKRSRSFDDTQ